MIYETPSFSHFLSVKTKALSSALYCHVPSGRPAVEFSASVLSAHVFPSGNHVPFDCPPSAFSLAGPSYIS